MIKQILQFGFLSVILISLFWGIVFPVLKDDYIPLSIVALALLIFLVSMAVCIFKQREEEETDIIIPKEEKPPWVGR